jgi:hypothetical protein
MFYMRVSNGSRSFKISKAAQHLKERQSDFEPE